MDGNKSNGDSGSTGRRGLSLGYGVRENESQAELYIDFGAEQEARNQEVFNQFLKERASIEMDFGGPLDWQDLPDSRGCCIRKIVEGGYRSPVDEQPEIFARLVDAMIRLDKTFKPFIQKLGS